MKGQEEEIKGTKGCKTCSFKVKGGKDWGIVGVEKCGMVLDYIFLNNQSLSNHCMAFFCLQIYSEL